MIKDPDFDWHRPGIWIVMNPKGEYVQATLAVTAWSARVEACRHFNSRPNLLQDNGFTIIELVPAKSGIDRINAEGYAVADESRWRYPANGEPAPQGAHVQLLTIGGKQVPGVWTGEGGFVAWAPNIKRDKDLERRLGL